MVVRVEGSPSSQGKYYYRFANGWKVEVKFPYKSRVIDNEISGLEDIAQAIQEINDNGLNQAFIPNAPCKTDENGEFQRKGEWLENSPWRIGVFDFDWVDAHLSTLPFQKRVEACLEALPFDMGGVGYVATATGSYGVQRRDKKKKVGLRIFFELSKPLMPSELKSLFGAWHGTDKVGTIDTNIFTQTAIILVRLAELTKTERTLDQLLHYQEGQPFDVDSIYQREDYKKHLSQKAEFSGITNDKTLTTKEALEQTLELAKAGYFEGRRNLELFKLFSGREWTQGDAAGMLELVLKTPELRGDRKDDTITSQYQRAIENAENRFLHNEALLDWGYQFEEIKERYLPDADLSAIEQVVRTHWHPVIAVKSPHESAKTTALVPMIERIIKEKFGKDPRILYIAPRKSVLHQASEKLELECYITQSGVIRREEIHTFDRAASTGQSLPLFLQSDPFHIVVVDESKILADEITWKDVGFSALLEIAASAEVVLFMDADLGVETFSIATKVAEMMPKNLGGEQSKTYFLKNTKSRIKEETCYLLDNDADFWTMVQKKALEKKKLFINLQHADVKLQAIQDYLNQMNPDEEDWAICIDSHNAHKYPEFFKNPDRTISEWFDKGITIIATSPVIDAGWRYSEAPHFDYTFNLMDKGFWNANKIIQSMMRCVGVKEHFTFISKDCDWLNADDLEKQYAGEYEKQIFPDETYGIPGIGKTINNWKVQRETVKAKELSNVRLHFAYLWAKQYGGKLVRWATVTDNYDKRRIHNLIGIHLKDAKQAEAAAIYNDPEKAEKLCNNFLAVSWRENEEFTRKIRLEGIKETRELIKRKKQLDIHSSEAEEILNILISDEKQLAHWDQHSPTYKANAENRHFYVILGQLLHLLFEPLVTDKDYKDFIVRLSKRDFTLTFDTDDIDTTKAAQLLNQYGRVLSNRTYIDKNSTPTTVIRKILKDVFDLDLVTEPAYEGNGPELKKAIIEEYRTQKYFGKTGKQANKIRLIKKEIFRKLINQEELSTLEKDFHRYQQSIFTIKHHTYPSLCNAIDRHNVLCKLIGSKDPLEDTDHLVFQEIQNKKAKAAIEAYKQKIQRVSGDG